MEFTNYTVIDVYADFIYFIMIGDKKNITFFINKLNKSNKDNTIKYIATRIDTPLSIYCKQLQILMNKHIEINSSVESAQSYAFAQNIKKNSYNILILEEFNDKFILSFPKLDFKNNDDPEQLIFKWITRKVSNIPQSIYNTIKPVSVVGSTDNILVYIANLK